MGFLNAARLMAWLRADIRISLAREVGEPVGGRLLDAMIVKFNTEPSKIFYVWAE